MPSFSFKADWSTCEKFIFFSIASLLSPNTTAPEEIGAYVLGEFEPIKKFRGRIIAVIKRENDNEDILVVAKTLNSYSKSDIEVLTEFQERWFLHGDKILYPQEILKWL
jgi:inorganic pyrophosphatase